MKHSYRRSLLPAVLVAALAQTTVVRADPQSDETKDEARASFGATAAIDTKIPDEASVSSGSENTAINARDKNGASTSVFDQGSSTRDRQLAAQLRRIVVDDKTLSMTAHNIKIIVNHGQVTLRGPVKDEREHERIAAMVSDIAGGSRVIDNLDVAK